VDEDIAWEREDLSFVLHSPERSRENESIEITLKFGSDLFL
jgi:hypothetical protein